MFLVAKFQSVAIPNVVREVMLLLSLFREVTTCYGFTGKERRLSTKVRVPEKEKKHNANKDIVFFDIMPQSYSQNLV